MRRGASVKDVAAAAGVSLGTVSNVLNRPDRVSAATRERVERAMAELGFVRNESARQLRAGTSRTLAYVMLDAAQPVLHRRRPGHRGRAAEAADLSLFLCNSANSAEREQAHLALLQQQRVQGILVTPGRPRGRRSSTTIVAPRHPRGDRRPDPRRRPFCSVAVDDVLGGRLAVEHLIDRGHTRVAFVGGPTDARPGPRPAAPGRRAAWAEAGLPGRRPDPARHRRR